jgi:hypothetical protein
MRICARWAGSAVLGVLAACVPPGEAPPVADAPKLLVTETDTLRELVRRFIREAGPAPRPLLSGAMIEGLEEWIRSDGEAVFGVGPADPPEAGRWKLTRRKNVIYAIWPMKDDELFLPATLTLPLATLQPWPGTTVRLLGHEKPVAGLVRDMIKKQLTFELPPDLALRPYRRPALILAFELDTR